jgi:uncharacterized protein (DUF2062 family)
MIHLTRAIIRRWMDTLLHIDDTPRRTAASYALGVFFGFSPFLGLHTILGVALAFVFNLNRVAAVLGVYSNLPWVIVPYYAFATMSGAVVTRANLPDDFRNRLEELFTLSFLDGDFWQHLWTLLQPLLWPYTVGSLICAAILSALAYRLAFVFLVRRRRFRDYRSVNPKN